MVAKPKILILVGPTSSGKSALAVELARKFNGEVISADSRQVYRGLDIGTGKITKKEMKGIRHHLLDVANPQKRFTAQEYRTHTNRAIASVVSRGKLPIVAGGTGFYIDALMGRVALPDVPPNLKLRRRLAKKTTGQLFALLKKRDPKRAKAMNTPSERNNKVRLIRALEITADKEKTIATRNSSYDALWVGINPGIETLENKISLRLRQRIKQGMIREAKRLHTEGLSYKRMQELGLEYRSLAAFLQGKITKSEMINELNRAIRKYAKRQLVYWKRNWEIQWVDPKDRAMVRKKVSTFVRDSK